MANEKRYKNSTFEQRVEWLIAHKDLWYKEYYNLSSALKHHGPFKRRLVMALKHDGLIAKSTYWPDVKLKEELISASLVIRKTTEPYNV